jgi:hypothetical protein
MWSRACSGRVEVARALSDDDAQLDLPVELGGSARHAHVVVRADERVRALRKQDRLVGYGHARLGSVIRIVEPDTQDLVRASDGGADAVVAERMHGAGRDTLSDDGLEAEHPAAVFRSPEETFVEVGGDVRDVDVRVLVDTHGGLFVARRAEAHELHR